MDATKQNDLFADIARRILSIDTLEPRNMDDLDFHEVSVQSVAKALQAAYDAGQEAAFQIAAEDEGLRGADACDALRFAKAYASLGDAIGEQVEDLVAGDYQEVNPNAAEYMRERLAGFNAEIDDALDAYADECDGDDDEADDDETC